MNLDSIPTVDNSGKVIQEAQDASPAFDLDSIPTVEAPKRRRSILERAGELNKEAGANILAGMQGMSGTIGALGETALGGVTGMIAYPISWASQMATSLRPDATPEMIEQVGNIVNELVAYQPEDPRAQGALETLFYPFEAGFGMAREAADLVSESRGVPKTSIERKRGQLIGEAGLIPILGRAGKVRRAQTQIAKDAVRDAASMRGLEGVVEPPLAPEARYTSPELQAQRRTQTQAMQNEALRRRRRAAFGQAEQLELDLGDIPTVKADSTPVVEAPPKIIPAADVNQGVLDFTKPAPDYAAQAEAAGAKFNGMQKVPNGEPIPMFTSDIDGVQTTFMLEKGETLPQAIQRKLAQKERIESSYYEDAEVYPTRIGIDTSKIGDKELQPLVDRIYRTYERWEHLGELDYPEGFFKTGKRKDQEKIIQEFIDANAEDIGILIDTFGDLMKKQKKSQADESPYRQKLALGESEVKSDTQNIKRSGKTTIEGQPELSTGTQEIGTSRDVQAPEAAPKEAPRVEIDRTRTDDVGILLRNGYERAEINTMSPEVIKRQADMARRAMALAERRVAQMERQAASRKQPITGMPKEERPLETLEEPFASEAELAADRFASALDAQTGVTRKELTPAAKLFIERLKVARAKQVEQEQLPAEVRRRRRQAEKAQKEETPEDVVDEHLDASLQAKWDDILEREGLGIKEDALDSAVSLEEAGLSERDPFLSDRGPRELTFDMLGGQQIYEAVAEMVRRNPTMQNAIRLAKTAMLEGVRTFGAFRARARQILGDAFSAMAGHLRKAWDAAVAFNEDLGQRGSLWNAEQVPTVIKGLAENTTNLYSRMEKAWNDARIRRNSPVAKVVTDLSGAPSDYKVTETDVAAIKTQPTRLLRLWADPMFRWKGTLIEDTVWRAVDADSVATFNIGANALILDRHFKKMPEADQIAVSKALRKEALPTTIEQAAAVAEIQNWLSDMRVRVQESMRRDIDADLAEFPKEQAAFRAILDGDNPLDALGSGKGGGANRRIVNEALEKYDAVDLWGFDDYLPQVELGDIALVNSEGKLIALGTTPTVIAKKAARYWFDADGKIREGVDKNLRMVDKSAVFKQLDVDLRSKVTASAYRKITKNLSSALKKENEDVTTAVGRELAHRAMAGVFSITPSPVFSPFMQPRRGVLKGEENLVPILYRYSRSVERKIAIDPVLREIKRIEARTDLSKSMRQELDNLARTLKGSRTKVDEVLDEALDIMYGKINKKLGTELIPPTYTYTRAMGAVRNVIGQAMLGYRPVAAAVNLVSGQLHTMAKVGEANWASGIAFLRTPEGKALLKEVEGRLGTSVIEEVTGLRSTATWYKPMGLHQLAELPNREVCVAANYIMAKRSGKAHTEAVEMAIRANAVQQFMYAAAALPIWMRGPGMRTLAQFKPYLIKEMQFLATLRGAEIPRYMLYNLALFGPRALFVTLKSLPLIMAITGPQLWEDWEIFMETEYPRLARGLSGEALGVDISAAAAVQFPTQPADWLGPSMRVTEAVLQVAREHQKGVESTTGDKVEGVVESYAMIYRNVKDVIDMIMSDDGWVRNDKRQKMYNIFDVNAEPGEQWAQQMAYGAQRLFGSQPVGLAAERNLDRISKAQERRWRDNRYIVIDKVLERIIANEPVPQELWDEVYKYGVDNKAWQASVRYKELTPEQRRILFANKMRKEEALELAPAPEAFDVPFIPSRRRRGDYYQQLQD